MKHTILLRQTVASLAAVFVLAASLPGLGAGSPPGPGRWPEEKTNQWLRERGWLRGCNFIPSTAINELEMWQADTFDPATIDRELGWAASLGFNSMRVFLHDLLWTQDPQGFLDRMDKFLAIADRHGIGVMFVLFDSCWDPFPKLGKQHDPKPGLHNSGWVQSPGAEILKDPSRHEALKSYVVGVVGRFANDRRVHAWDVWNEPDNTNGSSYSKQEPAGKASLVRPLMLKAFSWAREAKPAQPLTSGVWQGTWGDPRKLTPMEQAQLDNSDVISFHCYGKLDNLQECVRNLRRYQRPVLCTEYMSRGNSSTFNPHLGYLKEETVAAYNWGLVDGKTQTIYPWDSWKKPYSAEPAVWFHDIFRRDGTAYWLLETDYIRHVTARAGEQAKAAPPSGTAPGPFRPTMESLEQFQCPDWFRDAKFGIWAHWGPQSVPMAGDWYARHLYTQDNKRGQYQHHLTNYGHPSTNGWKDIIPLWKAEKFDPDRLMRLYKQAGAKYFVSMGVHHDNFDLWNSKYHRWNAVQMGPHRDIVGTWQKAAKKQGLPFGVSEHLGASFWWWQVNKGSDTSGPLAGVPYDGADPKYEDLYHWPAAAGDTNRWYTSDPRWHQEWFKRIKDLVDSYHPDLLYTDGGVPFGEVGRTLIAHLYNSDIQRHGKLGAVYTCKAGMNKGEFVQGSYVQDMERGVLAGINPLPWQTDTSIGDWFYNKDWKTKDTGRMYRSAEWVVRTLVDIVSKNGNLLLNVIQRPDGALDPEVEQLLADIGAWMKVNGEAIYGTRPWLTYGEGETKADGGHFKEDFAFSAQDIRFTTKGKTLYAIALGWPAEGQLVIKSLAKPATGTDNQIKRVELLGHRGKLAFTQTPEGLRVTLPATKLSDIACSLRIIGGNLRPVGASATGSGK